MKKLLIASFLIAGCFGVVKADQEKFLVPVSKNNIPNPTLESAGVEKSFLVTSTTPVLLTDRNGITMTNGLIYWVVCPSTAAAASSFLEVRDTATANVTSAHMFPNIAPLLNTANGDQIRIFTPPVPFYNGLSLDILMSGNAAASAGMEFSVGIRTKK